MGGGVASTLRGSSLRSGEDRVCCVSPGILAPDFQFWSLPLRGHDVASPALLRTTASSLVSPVHPPSRNQAFILPLNAPAYSRRHFIDIV